MDGISNDGDGMGFGVEHETGGNFKEERDGRERSPCLSSVIELKEKSFQTDFKI